MRKPKRAQKGVEIIPQVKESPKLTLREAQALADCARGPLRDLHIAMSRGNSDAAQVLVNFIDGAIQSLNASLNASQATDILRKMARTKTHWPGHISARGTARNAQNFARYMELGSELGLQLDGKIASTSEPHQMVAYFLWETLNRIRTGIETVDGITAPKKPLSRDPDNLKEWWKCAQQLLHLDYGEHIEDNPFFSHWLEKKDESGKPLREQFGKGGAKSKSRIRGDIEGAIRQSLERLASVLSK